MFRARLRTKLLVSLLLISSALTWGTLLIVRHNVQTQVRAQIAADLNSSLTTFQSFQRQREEMLADSAELVANLPSLKAMMTTRDAATIQDASGSLWRLSGSDLFALADRSGNLVALHTSTPGLSRGTAQESLSKSIEKAESGGQWWFGGGHLYEVFLRPVYFGAPANNSLLGALVVGHEIDDRMAKDVSRIASSQVAFHYDKTLVVSTLSPTQEAELARLEGTPQGDGGQPGTLELGGERFLAVSENLATSAGGRVRLDVLKSYDQATAFLTSLNRLLMALGLVAVAAGSVLAYLISDTFTRPLANLVAGVRALEKGDYTFPLEKRSGDEVAEVSAAFARMRDSLQTTQEQLLHAERLATIGRMASYISHDLRHPLTAIIANAEFLCADKLSDVQREELYQEIRGAVDRMTALVDSLLEFSRTRESLSLTHGKLRDVIERSVHSISARPEFQRVSITVSSETPGEGWFDARKVERVFENLLLNACQAVPQDAGKVEIHLRQSGQAAEIHMVDNGSGIPAAIRDTLFQPFVSHGKDNGTGLGLTVAQKIFQDHGGDVSVESTAAGRTVFKLLLPLAAPTNGNHAD